MWEIRFNFVGEDNLERTLCRTDITILNLVALIETQGYGIMDKMYYVKEKGSGMNGMELVDSMAKVETMLSRYQSEKVLNLTVIRANAAAPVGLNMDTCEPQIQLTEPVLLAVDEGGLTYITDDASEDELFPVAVDFTDALHVGTQQSSNMHKGVECVYLEEDEEFYYDMGEYRPEERDKQLAEELEAVKQIQEKNRKGKGIAVEEDSEEKQILKILQQQKKQRDDPFMHFEGDTDVEELYQESSDSDEEVLEEPLAVSKLAVRKGPTSRSHHEPVGEDYFYFLPSSDEEKNPGDLGDSDDDGAVEKFKLASGRKSRRKKPKLRVWYDESRANPQDQLCLKMCFTDVYQFRRALRQLHVSQLRNYAYWRNNKDRVIVVCSEEKCPFYMVGSEIKHEKTFCIRKMSLKHHCAVQGESTKVTIDWVAKASEQTIRTDPKTCVDTLIENAKLNYGVEVPRSKAYRARKKALEVVIGDQKAQYTRLRDYLQTVLETNPGSRCIVTTKELLEHPSPNPRFHGLFYCLNASKEGFINGCRPFIGKL